MLATTRRFGILPTFGYCVVNFLMVPYTVSPSAAPRNMNG
jgi:hypothetical protein